MLGLERARLLDSVHTTVSFQQDDLLVRLMPQGIRDEMLRRTFAVDRTKIHTDPWLELTRTFARKARWDFLIEHETGMACVDAIYGHLDQKVSSYVARRAQKFGAPLTGVYAYEDCALKTFTVARQLGIKCLYDLPIAYWQTARKLLSEEADRYPDWAKTLTANYDSDEKLSRKTQEIELADTILCPSEFVYRSLPDSIRQDKNCRVAEFGSPERPATPLNRSQTGPLRILFAGSMTQRKGLADVFAAMKLLNRKDVELVVLGSLQMPMSFYRQQYANFVYEAPRPNQQVLSLMQTCHVLVLPSIVEGRALVQQEAMACQLPVISTANAGAEDMIAEQETGFLVPIRAPEVIAEKISWFADHRAEVERMGRLAATKAAARSWQAYQDKVLDAIAPTTNSMDD